MNSRITLIIVAFSVMTFSMIPLQQQIWQKAFAQNDESQTGIEQSLNQKNLGSGESTNFNCADNTLEGSPSSLSLCQTAEEEPPEEPTTPFLVAGEGSGTLSCQGGPQAAAIIEISVQGDGTGTVGLGVESAGTFLFPVTGGPDTDGITFGLIGETSPGIICGDVVQSFTVSGVCGNDVMIFYEEPDMLGTFTGDVECALA